MKLTEHVLMLSGVPYSTNSNTYAILSNDQVLLIDSGYGTFQWSAMNRVLKDWGWDKYPITHLFLTHAHFDHAGNAHRLKETGARICISALDGISLREGNKNTLKMMTNAFPDPFIPCEPDQIIKAGDILDFENVCLEVIEGRGHSSGSLLFMAHVDDKKVLFTGDCISIGPDDAKDNVLVHLAWCGGPDAIIDDYGRTLMRASELKTDILAPGHYHPFFGDSRPLFREAIKLFKKQYHC